MNKRFNKNKDYSKRLNNTNKDYEYDEELEYNDDEKINKIVKNFGIILGIVLLIMIIAFIVVKSKKPISSADSSSHTHVYAKEYTVDKQPTCKESGIESRHCTFEDCDAVIDERRINKTEHKFDKGKVEKEPTCKEEGIKILTCIVCGEIKEEKIPTLDHKYGDKEILTPSTCTEEGLIAYKCIDCEYVKEEVIPVKDHELNDTIYEDNTDSANIKYYKICKNCNTRVYTDKEGIKENENTKQIKQNAENVSQEINCKEGNHDFKETEILVEPTCSREGRVIYTCTGCKKEKIEVIPKKEHDNEEIINESTCTRQGTLTTKCKVCGYVTSKEYLPLKEHDFTESVANEGSCTSDRIIKYTCKDCGFIKEENKGKVDNHSFEDVTITEDGTEYAITRCKDCGKETSRVIIKAQEDEKIEEEITENE